MATVAQLVRLGMWRGKGGGPPPPPTVVKIAPSAQYDGTEGSGFDVEPVASAYRTSSDPWRPMGGPFQGSGEAFNADLTLSFYDLCANSAYEVSPEMSKVRLHVEGTVADITEWTERTWIGGDGVERSDILRNVVFDHAGVSVDGWWRYYVEFIPADPALDSRIIGPFRAKRVSRATIWEADVPFGPGETRATLKDALDFCRTSGYQHARVRATSSHALDFASTSFPTLYSNPGIIDVGTDPGVTFTIGKSTQGFPPGGVSFNVEGLRFNKGVVFDLEYLQGLHIVNSRPYWFNGAEFYSSISGVNDLKGDTGLSTAKNARSTGNFQNGGIYTECYFHDLNAALGNNQLLRCCKFKDFMAEPLNPPSVSVGLQWCLFYRNEMEGQDPAPLRDLIDSISVTYSGPLSQVEVDITGGLNASTRRFELWEEGSLAQSIAISTTVGSGVYTNSDLVDAINAFSGYTAVLIDDSRRAAAIGGVQPGLLAGDFTKVSIKDAVVTVGSSFDIHLDACQWGSGSGTENAIVFGKNWHSGGPVQWGFFDKALDKPALDCAFVNNQGGFSTMQGGKSQISGLLQHFLLLNNSMANQQWLVNDTPTEGLIVRGNVFEGWGYRAGKTSGDMVAKNNHFFSSPPLAGPNVSDNTTGGAFTDYFEDIPAGDARPKGALLSKTSARLTASSISGRARGATSLIGAEIATSGG